MKKNSVKPYVVSIFVFIAILTILALKVPPFSSCVFMQVVDYKRKNLAHKEVVYGREGWLFYKPELDYVVDTFPSDNIDRIVEFDKSLHDHGMALFVVPIPNKIDIYPEKFTLVNAPSYVKKERLEMFKKLRAKGVHVIDLVPTLVKGKKQCLVFDPYETHWTPEGTALAAKNIVQEIDSAMSMRRYERRTDYSVFDTVLRARGDLRNKLCDTGTSFWYDIRVKQVICPNGTLYVDDRKSNIMILGDSFVDRGRWWNSHLGAQIALFAKQPTRTFCSLRANWAGPSMYQEKPSVFPEKGIVIWAFTSRVLRYHLTGPSEKKPHAKVL